MGVGSELTGGFLKDQKQLLCVLRATLRGEVGTCDSE